MTPAQLIMIADGLPALFCMTVEERRAAWAGVQVKDAVNEISEARRRGAVLKKEADRLKALSQKRQAQIEKRQPTQDTTGMRWCTRRSRWVPDEFADVPKALPTQINIKPAVEGSAFESEALIEIINASPRQPGTKAAAKYKEMLDFVKQFPGSTIGAVMANTNYQKNDYIWDLRKGNIK